MTGPSDSPAIGGVRAVVALVVAAVGVLGLAAGARAGEPFHVDLTGIANTALEDDGVADNGKGGWSDEGINDMYLYPPLPAGKVVLRGYPFHLIDPKANGDKAVVMLRGSSRGRDKPETVSAKVPGVKGRYVFFLQHCVGPAKAKAGYVVATCTVTYADGSSVDIPMRDGEEIRQWWVGQWWENKGRLRWPVHVAQNVYTRKWRQYIGLWATRWENPSPDKPIAAIGLRSGGQAAAVIYAITISDEDYSANIKDKANDVRRPPDVPPGWFDAKLALENRMIFGEMVRAGLAKGVRRVELIRRDMLAVTVDAALGHVGAGPGEKVAAAMQTPETFLLTSETDAAYQPGRQPSRVGRHSYEYWNGDIGPFPQNVVYWHTYYLLLPSPMKAGHTYTVAVRPMDKAFQTSASIACDDNATTTPVIKINQVAYSSRAGRRYAYLGWWAGDAGKVDYSGLKRFAVVDEKAGRSVLEGPVVLRKADDPLSGEDVYEMDLSALKAGRYHIVVAGLGRSDSFGVGGEAIDRLYRCTHRAFYHQRCGMELAQPHTEFIKPACHTRVYESGYLAGSRQYAPAEGEKVREFRGGYHDAADFDVFTYHLRATAQALAAWELAPDSFRDGDLKIPESGNGVPDVLDEADWALFSYRDGQQDDGAVPLGRGNDQDAIRDWQREHDGKRPPYGVFPPETTSSAEYAAVAAQYGWLMAGRDKTRSDGYLQSARRAFAWAMANPRVGKRAETEGPPLLAWAAAELYRATGDEAVHEQFKTLCRAGALRRIHWKTSQFAPIFLWPYVACRREGVDRQIQAELKADLIRRADGVVKQTDLPAYRVGRGPAERGNGWGNLNGGGHYADVCLRAWFLTGDQRYLDAACLNADFQLGANPLSKTFLTALGARPPNHPQISAFLYTGPNKTGRTVEGITVYGLSDRKPDWYPAEEPPWRRWRDLGNGGAEVSSEFTITETIGASAFLYGLLHALEPRAGK